MPEQLTFDGRWEPIAEPHPVAESTAVEAQLEAPPPVVLPNQQDLFVGIHVYEEQARSALLMLDAARLRAVIDEASLLWQRVDQLASWAAWADAIDAQLDPPEAQLQRALDLDDEQLSRRLPGASSALAAAYREEALARAASRELATRGAAARLPDGRAVAELLIDAQRLEAAAKALAAAVVDGCDDGHTRTRLASVLWSLGRRPAALAAQCEALLHDPAGVRESEIQIPPLLDLLDDLADEDDCGEPLPWLPILAELRGVQPLPPSASPAPADASSPRQVAALLVDLRRERDPAQRLQIKRSIGNLAPWLRPHVRKR